MNAIADKVPQKTNDAALALLTCVMCGGENALGATQCESCGAALQSAISGAVIVAAPPRETPAVASTRAPLSPAAAQAKTGDAPRAAAPLSAAPESETQTTRASKSDGAPANDASAATINRSGAISREVSERAAVPDTTQPQINSGAGALSPDTARAMNADAETVLDIGKTADKTSEVATQSAASTRRISAAQVAHSAPNEERDARALLDRAFTLAESGQIDAAILACSEAATLQPQSAPVHSMLGLLLERAGDINGAIKACGRALQIAPESRLDRDSIARLQAVSPQSPVPQSPVPQSPVPQSPVPQAAPVKSVAPPEAREVSGAASPAVSVSPTATLVAQHREYSPTHDATEISRDATVPPARPANPETTRAPVAAATIASGANADATAAVDATATVTSKTASTRASADDLGRATQNDISALSSGLFGSSAEEDAAFDDANTPRENTPRWNLESARHSYFGRSLPLALGTLLGVWFLLWASRHAPQRVASTRAVTVAPAPTEMPLVAVAAPTETAPLSVQEQLAAAVAAARAAPQSAPPTALPAPANVAPANVADAPSATTLPATMPTAAATPISALPVAPTPVPSTMQAANTISPPAPAPIGGAPLSPAAPPNALPGAFPPQGAAPPLGDSTSFERAAQLQQRALSALEAGDNAAAARGFANAIAAYNAQIATGFRVDEARAAIAACRDGARLTQQVQR